MVIRSPEFDKGFQDELERLGVIPPRVTVPAPPTPIMRAVKPGVSALMRPPVAPTVLTAPTLRSVQRPLISQSRPGSPPPATPTAAETTTVQPAPTAPATPAPTATPTVTPPAAPVIPTPTDTPIAATPTIPASTPHTASAVQVGVAVPEGSTEAPQSPEGYRQVRTPDGQYWVVDYQGRLARRGAPPPPRQAFGSNAPTSVNDTLTTPDTRVDAAVQAINAARGVMLRPRAAYGSDAEYTNAQTAAQQQIDRSQAVIDTQGAQTTEVQQIAADNAEATQSAQAMDDYRNTPIESGPYAGQTLEQIQDRLILPSLNDRQWQTAITNPQQYGVDPSTGINMVTALGLPTEAPEGFTQEQWNTIIASAPPMSADMQGSYTQDEWVMAIFQSRVLNAQGIQLSDNDGNWVTSVISSPLRAMDWARGYNVEMMGEDVHAQINGTDRPNITAATGAILPGTNPFNTWALDPANQAAVNEVYDHGYTGADGTQFIGGRAVWEYYASQQNLLTRSLQDILLDPLNWLELLSGGGGLAIRGGTALADAGGVAGIAGRGLRVAGRAAQVPGRVLNDVPDAVLGGTARVGVGIIQESDLNNPVTRSVIDKVGNVASFLRRSTPEGQALNEGRETAQAGARVYDADGQLIRPEGRPGIDDGGGAATAGNGPTVTPPGNRVRFVTPTTPAGTLPTRPGTGIVADVSTTSRPRHIVFRNEDGTSTVVPVTQRVAPNADTTTRPRHIVVRTTDGRETTFDLPNVDTTDRPIHVVIQHADGTETTIPPEMTLAPNADVTARPGTIPAPSPARVTVNGPDGRPIPITPTVGVPGRPSIVGPATTQPPGPVTIRAPRPVPRPVDPLRRAIPESDAPDPLDRTLPGDGTQTYRDELGLPQTRTPEERDAIRTSNPTAYDPLDPSTYPRGQRRSLPNNPNIGPVPEPVRPRTRTVAPVSTTGTPIPETPIARVGATQDEAIIQSSPRTATPDDEPYVSPSTVSTQRVPSRDTRISDTDYPELPASTRTQYDNIVLSNPDYSASGRYRQSLFTQDEATGDFRFRYTERQGDRIPEDFSPIIRDKPLPANPTRAEVTQAENFVSLIDEYVARHGGPETQPSAKAASSLRRDMTTADGLNRQLESLDNGRPSPRQMNEPAPAALTAPEQAQIASTPGPAAALPDTPAIPSRQALYADATAPARMRAERAATVTRQAGSGIADFVRDLAQPDDLRNITPANGGRYVNAREPVRVSGGEIAPLPSNAERRTFAAESRARQQDAHREAVRVRKIEQADARLRNQGKRQADREPIPPDLPAFRYEPEEYPIATAPTERVEDIDGGYQDYVVMGSRDREVLGKRFINPANREVYGLTTGEVYTLARKELDELARLQRAVTARPGQLSSADLKRVEKLEKQYRTGTGDGSVQALERSTEDYMVDRFMLEADIPLDGSHRNIVLRKWRALIGWTSRNLVGNILDVPRRLIQDFLGDSMQLAITGNFMAIPNQFRYVSDIRRASTGRALMDTPYAQNLRSWGVTSRGGGYTTDFLQQDRALMEQVQRVGKPGKRRGINAAGRDWVNAFDSARRMSIADGVWAREQRDLTTGTLRDVVREAQALGLTLTPEQWRSLLTNELGMGTTGFSGTDLYRLARTQALLDPSITPARAHAFADRVATRHTDRVLDVHNRSIAEVNRAVFNPTYTNADELVANVLAFHFYQTRSAKLYARQALRHPAIAANYYRATQGLQHYAEEHDLPASLNAFMRFIGSPAGFLLFVNPIAMWDVFNAAKQMSSDNGEENAFERLMAFPFMPGLNVPLSTVVNLAGYLPNGLSPDPTGTSSERQLVEAVINVIQPMWNPEATPVADPVNDGMSWLREQTSGILPGSTNVNSQDSTDYADSQVRALVITAAEEQFGVFWTEFTPEQLRLVQEAQWDPSNPLYRTAYDMYTRGMLIQETTQQFLNSQVRVRPETDLEIRQATDPQGDMAPDDPYDNEVGDLIPNAGVIAKRQGLARIAGDNLGVTTPLTDDESALYAERETAYDTRAGIDAGSEQAATLGVQQNEYRDSTSGTGPTGQGSGAVDIFNYVAYADVDSPLEGPLVVGGQSYTPERVAAMTPDERRALAQGLIDELDLTEDYTAATDAQHAYVDAHPEFAAYREWSSRARDYSGPGGEGPAGYWADLTAQNPNAAAWYDEQSDRYGGDDQIPEQVLTGTDGYLSVIGVQIGRFDGNPLSTGSGEDTVVADPATDPTFNTNAPAATTGTATSYAPDTPGDVVSGVLKAQAEYQADLATFDELTMATFGVTFDNANPWAQESITRMMRNSGIETPSPSGLLRDYQEWQTTDLAAGGDGSLDRFAEWRVQQKADEDSRNATIYTDYGLTSEGDALPAP